MVVWAFFFSVFFAINFLSASENPLYFTADKVVYNEKLDVIEAFGCVEISQFLSEDKKPFLFETKSEEASASPVLERFLKADRFVYNRKTKKITATGHVVAIDEHHNALFSEKIDMDETFDNGFVEPVRILLSNDEGRLTAKKGHRHHGNETIFHKATYSPCKICATKPVPLWQIRSNKVLHDHGDRIMVYHDVYLDLFGMPVLYTPYFRHPDPKVKRKSGLLMPTYGQSTDLGAMIKVPYFWVLGPHNDMTMTPIMTTKQGPIFAAEYRHGFRAGDIQLNGSLTQTRHLDRRRLRVQSTAVPPKTRFHLLSKGRFEMTDHDLLTFEVNRASDTTYLRRYNIIGNNQTFAQNKNLISLAKWEKFHKNNYLGVKSYAFQTDTPKTTPYVFPLAQYMYKSDPGNLGESFGFESHLLSLSRRSSTLNTTPKASTRGIVKGQFHLPYVTSSGQLVELDAQIRGDVYAIHDYATTFQSSRPSYTTGRAFPTTSVTWRYPFVRLTNLGQYVMEPVAQVVASPNGLNPAKIPNEDSRLSELEDLNLFYIERMNGFDRADSGRRFVYGVNTGLYGSSSRRITLFLGQSYRLDRQGVDLIGDHKNASDYVTRLQFVPIQWMRLHYRGRFDRYKLQNRFSEITANFGYPIFTVNTTYVYVDKRDTPSKQPMNQINWQALSKINDEWSVAFTQSKNLSRLEKNARAHMASAVYQNDCFQLSFGVYRTQFRDRDIRPDTGVLLQFNFKNLGTFKPFSSGGYPNVSLRTIGM